MSQPHSDAHAASRRGSPGQALRAVSAESVQATTPIGACAREEDQTDDEPDGVPRQEATDGRSRAYPTRAGRSRQAARSALELRERPLVVQALRAEEARQPVVPDGLVRAALLLQAAAEREVRVVVDRLRARGSCGTPPRPRRSGGCGSRRSRAPRGWRPCPARASSPSPGRRSPGAAWPAARWSRPCW